MTGRVDHIAGQTYHGRKGAVRNAFRYSIDYVLLDAEEPVRGPSLFRRNGRSVCALHDSDHGGAPGSGKGADWVRSVLREHQVPQPENILLLAQPRFWGHVFNPVSFWLCRDENGDLTCVIAEVTNTSGERHSYLCHHPDHRPIGPSDRLTATKIFYVSPVQPVEGGYEFRFDIRPDKIGIWIDYTQASGGLIATLTGPRRKISNGSILRSVLRRPLGSRRVLALIHWQALKLWWKGSRYRTRTEPPLEEVSN